MNPLLVLRDLMQTPAPSTNGTVVGQSGDRVLVRTSQGIKPVATDRLCTLGANLTMDAKGAVSGVLDNQDLIPEYKV